MHILEIPSFFPPLGGAFCLEQAKALKARGHEVRILACNMLGISVNRRLFLSAPFGRQEDTIEGITVMHTFMRGMPKAILYNQKRWCNIVLDMYNEYVRKYGKPDILHAHCCKWAGVAASIISEREDIPFFITEHLSSIIFDGIFGSGWKKAKWARQLLADTYKKASCVIPVSEELVSDIAQYFGSSYRYIVVSNIVDTDFFRYQNREPLTARPFRLCCLAVANIYAKGYDTLAQAIKTLDNVELHIAGSGTDSEAMKDLFADARVPVALHGGLDKIGVRDLLYHCDALVLPSRCEAQPLVVLEALATGIPVVTTDVISSSVCHPSGTIIAKVGNAESLSDALSRVMSLRPDPCYSDFVHQLSSPSKVAKELERIFEQNK